MLLHSTLLRGGSNLIKYYRVVVRAPSAHKFLPLRAIATNIRNVGIVAHIDAGQLKICILHVFIGDLNRI